MLAGQAIGQLANFSAASHLRTVRLVSVLHKHMSADLPLHIYYGSRAAQPNRVRASLDLAIARLHNSPNYMLNRIIGQPFVGLRDPLVYIDEAGMPTVVQIATCISTT